ncbi:MAG: hypothetical protein WAL29_11040 [Bacteroidales bacterium]
MKTKLLITGLAFMAMTTLVSAQNQGAGQRQMNGKDKSTTFVDADKDGICDNFETCKSSDFRGNRSANFKNAACQGQRKGMGQQGMKQGRNNQRNFVDADKNGICDFRETPADK